MILGITIETAFLGPTDTKGSRISATCKRDSNKTYRKIMDYRHDLNSEANHLRVAGFLMKDMDADTTYEGAESFRIVARGSGGRVNAGYHFIANRGGA